MPLKPDKTTTKAKEEMKTPKTEIKEIRFITFRECLENKYLRAIK